MLKSLRTAGYKKQDNVRAYMTFKLLKEDGNYLLIQNCCGPNASVDTVVVYRYSLNGDLLDHVTEKVTTQTWARISRPRANSQYVRE